MDTGATPGADPGAEAKPPEKPKKKRKHLSGAAKKRLRKMPPGLPTDENETELGAIKCLMLDPEPKTKQQWLMKRLLSSNPEKFLDRKLQLEKMAGAESTPTPPPVSSGSASPAITGTAPAAPSAPDLGTQRVGALVEKLLAEWGET